MVLTDCSVKCWGYSLSEAHILLSAETKAQEGDTPQKLPNALAEYAGFSLSRDAFLLSLPSGLRFHYVQGCGVNFSQPDTVADAEVRLFLNGSVYGAVAWINGFLPLHTSAIVHDGKIHAFTGESGAGKSTLSAALSARGLPLFADDVLVLDMRDKAGIMALPGHKKLKLWGDAIDMTGLQAGAQVMAGMDKFFVEPPLLDQSHPLPVTDLYLLDEAAQAPSLTPILGAARFTLVRSAFYRPEFCAVLAEKLGLFSHIARLANEVAIHRFDRPRNSALFNEGADFMAEAIRRRA